MPPDREPRTVLADLSRLGVSTGKVLDVGAGKGRFSKVFAGAGFEVTALEPDPAYAEGLRTLTTVRVVERTFEAWESERPVEAMYDVVIMGQVLEHARSPLLWLSKARELLKPRGILAIATPNFGSLLTLVLQNREGHICPPEHLNFYTREAIWRLISRAGLEFIQDRTRSLITRDLCVEAVRETTRWAHFKPFAGIAGHAVWFLLVLADPCGLGRYFHVYCRHPDPGSDVRQTSQELLNQSERREPGRASQRRT